jgi:hypothetical protein
MPLPPRDPNLLNAREAGQLLGCCARQVREACERNGLLPRPDPWGRWRREDVLTLAAEFERRRKEAQDDD